jgi:hypothetical protein
MGKPSKKENSLGVTDRHEKFKLFNSVKQARQDQDIGRIFDKKGSQTPQSLLLTIINGKQNLKSFIPTLAPRAIASKSRFAMILQIRQRATHRVLRKSPGSFHGSPFGA